jgi:hypothetical protein
MRVLSIVALIPGIPGFFITFFLVYGGWMWYQENPTNRYLCENNPCYWMKWGMKISPT